MILRAKGALIGAKKTICVGSGLDVPTLVTVLKTGVGPTSTFRLLLNGVLLIAWRSLRA